MSRQRPKNVAASVRQKLLDQTRQKNVEFQLVLTQYVIERFLYRLSQSPHQKSFVLKGAMLFWLWTRQAHRPTKDLDLLGLGDPSRDRVLSIFQEVCNQEVEEDGLIFDAETISIERIKEDQEYEGWRVRIMPTLERAQIPLQIDVGFGDSVVPEARHEEFPTLLSSPSPVLRAYAKETVVEEKYQAMVVLGIANSRMKDFYDIWILAGHFEFKGQELCAAIEATFTRRRTPIPSEIPLAWTAKFYDDPTKKLQWEAFLRKNKLPAPKEGFVEIIDLLQKFLWPPTTALASSLPWTEFWSDRAWRITESN